MQKRLISLGVIVVALIGIAVTFHGRKEPERKPDAAVPAKDTLGAIQSDSTSGTNAEAAVTNPRTRPSQPPVTRDYPKPKLEYPTAETVKGQPGFVLSPHNGKVVDVRDIPPGTLVADPTYPIEEKKYFRIPN